MKKILFYSMLISSTFFYSMPEIKASQALEKEGEPKGWGAWTFWPFKGGNNEAPKGPEDQREEEAAGPGVEKNLMDSFIMVENYNPEDGNRHQEEVRQEDADEESSGDEKNESNSLGDGAGDPQRPLDEIEGEKDSAPEVSEANSSEEEREVLPSGEALDGLLLTLDLAEIIKRYKVPEDINLEERLLLLRSQSGGNAGALPKDSPLKNQVSQFVAGNGPSVVIGAAVLTFTMFALTRIVKE